MGLADREPQCGVGHVVAAHEPDVLRVALPEKRHDRDRLRAGAARRRQRLARRGRAVGMLRHRDDVEAVKSLREAGAPAEERAQR